MTKRLGQWAVAEGIQLLNGRIQAAGEDPKYKQGWVKSPRGLTAKLKEIAPNLRREGVVISWGAHTSKGTLITLGRKVGDQPSEPSHRQTTNEINNLDSDGCRDGWENGESPIVTDQSPTATPENTSSPGSDDCVQVETTNRHTNRHSVNHSKEKDFDGVTILTVNSLLADTVSVKGVEMEVGEL